MGFFSDITGFVKKQAENIVEGVQDLYQEQKLNADINAKILQLTIQLRSIDCMSLISKKSELQKTCRYKSYDGYCNVNSSANNFRKRCDTVNCQNNEIAVLKKRIELAQNNQKKIQQEIARLKQQKETNIAIYKSQKNILQEKQMVGNEDMSKMEELIKTTIPQKMNELSEFNSKLSESIEVCKRQCIEAIETTYRKVLANSGIKREKYYEKYAEISNTYSFQINPTVSMSCDATIKKLTNLIAQKRDLIEKNKKSMERYSQLSNQMQQKYDDEYALQKLKRMNDGINSEIDNDTDISQNEEHSLKIRELIDSVDSLNKEIDTRRELEIRYGQIEI